MYDHLAFDEQLTKRVFQDIQRGKKVNQQGRIEPISVGAAVNTPWVFIAKGRHKFCGIYNGIMCQQHNLIPTYCRFQCWKTVIKPRNLAELFRLYNVLTRLQLPSKCGMDIRDYTFGAWAGFVYACSVPEGRRYHAKVTEALKKEFGQDQVSTDGSDFPEKVTVILKRGCTEMEAIKSSDQWDQIDNDELVKEKRIEDMYAHNDGDALQTQWVINSIMERWIKRGIEIGDPTVKQVLAEKCNDPNAWEKLVVHSLTYHDNPAPGEQQEEEGQGAA
jgi:hypothetical protein